MEKEKVELEKFPTSESAKRMLGYITPGFYNNAYVGKWLYEVMGQEYDSARIMVEDLPNQLFPETATWGLMYHELKWGLPVRENLSYKERRRLIYKKRDTRAPMTPYHIETLLHNLTGFLVSVSDCNDPGKYGVIEEHPNIFWVHFLGDGVLPAKNIRESLNKVKQSHTTYILNDIIAEEIIESGIEKVVSGFLSLLFLMHVSDVERLQAAITIAYQLHQMPETIEGMGVLITRNPWFLNGEMKLDGKNICNAIYRMEGF